MALKQLLKASTTTTTAQSVQIAKIRGFSLDILAELQSCGGSYTSEIAENLGKPKGYVKTYLHNLLKYGCVDRYARWGWEIAPLGVEILSINNNNIGKRIVKEESKKSQRRVKETSHVPHTTPTSRQLNINLFLQQQEDLSDDQVVVVVALANHYEKTGRPYLKIKDYYEFADKVGLPDRMDDAEIQDLVISLDVAGMIYTFKQGRYLKIGLLQSVVSNLQYC